MEIRMPLIKTIIAVVGLLCLGGGLYFPVLIYVAILLALVNGIVTSRVREAPPLNNPQPDLTIVEQMKLQKKQQELDKWDKPPVQPKPMPSPTPKPIEKKIEPEPEYKFEPKEKRLLD